MDRTTRNALLAALLACSLSGTTAVHAAEVGGSLAYSYGFKPEFHESDGPGNYHLVAGSAALKDGATAYRLGLSAIATNTPEREVSINDPSLSVGRSLPLGEGGLVLSGGVSASYGASLRSRDAGYRGSVGASVSLGQQFGELSAGIGTGVTRHLNRYTLSASGSPSAVYSASVSLSLGYALTNDLSAYVSLVYAKTHRYAGADVYSYANAFGVNYAVDTQLSFNAGLRTTDAQLSPNGSDNNELTLYKRNQTEGSVGFTYAL